jgi:hypothetical protein
MQNCISPPVRDQGRKGRGAISQARQGPHPGVDLPGNQARFRAVEILPAWRGKRLSEITKADVRKLVDGIAERPAPVSANRVLANLKTLFAFAVEQDLISASPAASVRPPAPEVARERARRGPAGFPDARRVGATVRLLILNDVTTPARWMAQNSAFLPNSTRSRKGGKRRDA